MEVLYDSGLIKCCSNPFDTYYLFLLSNNLLKDPRVKNNLNLLSLAFWCRDIEPLDICSNDFVIKPIGTVFHICPSNVPLMLFYSWIFSFLAGNYNIIKAPSKKFEEIDILIDNFKKSLIPNTKIVSYGHDDSITEEFSKQADARMIWGGDETIKKIKSIPAKLTTKDLCFSDKISYSIIDSERYYNLPENEKSDWCHKFVSDMYSFNQMACSSPRKLIWFGNKYSESRIDFYNRIASIALEKTTISSKIERDLFVYEDAMKNKTDYLCENYNSTLTVIIDDSNSDEHCGNGLLYDIHCNTVNDTIHYINKDKAQTVSYFMNCNEQFEFLGKELGSISRFIPIGSALKFTRYWDSYDLPMELVKYIAT